MSASGWLGTLIVVVCLLVVCYLLWIFLRRMRLSSRGGLFDCGIRKPGSQTWRAGLARYSGEKFEWYLLWRIGPGPSRVFVRSECEVSGFRPTNDKESRLGYAFSRILSVRVRERGERGAPTTEWELALNEGSAMGLLSWLEAAPPGKGDYLRQFDR